MSMCWDSNSTGVEGEEKQKKQGFFFFLNNQLKYVVVQLLHINR